MTAILWRVLIFVVIGAMIYFGARRIWRDWKGESKRVDQAIRKRDLRERERPDVITLERGKDGTFRPPHKDEDPRSS